MRHWNDDKSLAYSTWKIYLCHIESASVWAACRPTLPAAGPAAPPLCRLPAAMQPVLMLPASPSATHSLLSPQPA